jgi:uncharacterized protein YlxW (UPF0749 family)
MSTKMWGALWNFFASHWRAWVLATVVLVAYGAWKNRAANAAIVALNAANQQEIAQINQARADEEAQHQQEVQQLQDSLNQIQQQYQAAQAQLAAQQAAEQKQIVKQYGNDPTGLANLLAGKMGFRVQQ